MGECLLRGSKGTDGERQEWVESRHSAPASAASYLRTDFCVVRPKFLEQRVARFTARITTHLPRHVSASSRIIEIHTRHGGIGSILRRGHRPLLRFCGGE